jgi:ribosomal-protein-alanine N-acetyltransferase
MVMISLSPVRRADAAELVQANLDSRAYHQPWAQPVTSLDGFDDWFGTHMMGANMAFIVRAMDSGRIVGVTSLGQIYLKGFQNAYLGYYGMAEFAGLGLMTEAVRMTVKHAFEEIGLHRLEANIQPGNVRSIALVRRLGFRYEGFSLRYLKIGGVWCDHQRWAILADEFSG